MTKIKCPSCGSEIESLDECIYCESKFEFEDAGEGVVIVKKFYEGEENGD